MLKNCLFFSRYILFIYIIYIGYLGTAYAVLIHTICEKIDEDYYLENKEEYFDNLLTMWQKYSLPRNIDVIRVILKIFQK